MQTYRRAPFSLVVLTGFVLLSVLLAACGSAAPSTTSTAGGNTAQTNVSIGLGYIPDIQFAPFYVAVKKGYYQEAGLNVSLNHGVVPDLVGQMMAGKDTFVFAGGDDTLVARSKNLPVVNVSTIYPSYPISLIVPDSSSIKTLADIKGHTIGVPGKFGSTYVGLLALLHAVNLTEKDVKLQTIGFTQVAALKAGRVDAVMGYTNNEPLQLRRLGLAVRTFDVPNYQPMVSNGIVTTEKTLNSSPALVRTFVQATIKGLNYVLSNPSDAVQISKSFIPGMNLTAATDELNATLPIWKSNGQNPLGYNNPTTWQAMAQFMEGQGLIPANTDVRKAFVNE
ncbi:MAG TPA: ABC transporter substrate-binding protein [Ktedonobacteraceae bacterium]